MRFALRQTVANTLLKHPQFIQPRPQIPSLSQMKPISTFDKTNKKEDKSKSNGKNLIKFPMLIDNYEYDLLRTRDIE